MLKRDSKLFFTCLIRAGILLIILTSIFTAAAGVMSRSADNDGTVKLAISDNEDSFISRVLIDTISKLEFVSNMLTAEKTDEASAMAGVRSGKYAAAVILPDGFVDDVMGGAEASGKIYLSSSAENQAEVIASVASLGEKLLSAGQYGVFSGEELIREHGLRGSYHSDYLAKVNPRLLGAAFSAVDGYFTVENIGVDGTGITKEGHYTLCWLTMLLFMVSVFFIPLFTADMRPDTLARLHTLGVGAPRFFGTKLLLMLAFRLVIILLAVIFLGGFAGIIPSPGALLSALFASVIITLSGTALTICLGDGISANVIWAIGGIFISGGIIPRELLPKWVRALSVITPFGSAKALLEPMLGAHIDRTGAVLALLYTLLSLLLIYKKYRRVLSGGKPC